ncbi:putative Ribosomal_L7Ae domain-containing protein [Candidatus Hydrogenisulfobacillus filiaventi]|uniref:Putative Ribosomal_L7Ae domain-containing protein n=1 Tax=Candidatus Hydrogenisulfobacillus filiaventi TaxID=2707344 RepID=A0A6F8ZFW5_9FIRM|nr:putative Ribosomal_L7Ae domain-containing protein [Candidatus Hydrogenisulfobacillus filiaventi]
MSPQPMWMNYLGLARKAGALAPGSDRVEAALKNGQLRLLILATDAGGAAVRKFRLWCRDAGVAVVVAGTKDELGHATGLPALAVAGILRRKLADALLKSLPPDTVVEIPRREGPPPPAPLPADAQPGRKVSSGGKAFGRKPGEHQGHQQG